MNTNRFTLYPFFAISMAIGLSGCWASEGQLRQKAASDFQCPPAELAVKEVKPDVYEVAGCDQKNTYVYSSEAKAWLRESDAGGRVIQ